MPVQLTREHLLDWFDEWSPAEHSADRLLAAYNALNGSSDTLGCTNCGAADCPGRVAMAQCGWLDIRKPRKSASDFARNH